MEKSSEDIASSTLCAGDHFGRWLFTAWCQKDIRLEMMKREYTRLQASTVSPMDLS